jgi:hypothetical protein
MRRLVIATTLAAGLAPLAAIEAAAAPGVHVPRTQTYKLGCEVMRSFIDVRNTTGRTIPKGTSIELVIVVAGNRTFGVKKTVSTKLPFSAAQYHAFAPVPQGARSCSATVKLLPDYLRR